MLIINEIISALEKEIDALNGGHGKAIITLINGEIIREIAAQFIYQFTTDNFLIILDGTPAKIEISGITYDCEIISTDQQKIQISINRKFDDKIPSAILIRKDGDLLDLLRKKFEVAKSTPIFENSEKLFNYNSSKIDAGDFEINYSLNKDYNPNSTQEAAIKSSINDTISIIWGPPGTGKTQTIAKAIESHLNLGRTVLLLSHSNNAVDQALLKVAEQMRFNYYDDGYLVRLGTPKPEMAYKLENKCSLVFINNIIEHKYKALFTERAELNQQLEKIVSEKESSEKVNSLQNEINNLSKKIIKGKIEIETIGLNISNTTNEILFYKTNIEDLEQKLKKAKESIFIKRLILGLNLDQIENNLELNNSILFDKTKKLKNMKNNLSNIAKDFFQ